MARARGSRPQEGNEAPNAAGELQRRVGAILDGGFDRQLCKSALRVFLRCRQWANFKRCTFQASVRTLSAQTGLGQTSAWRGMRGLIDAGIVIQTGVTKAGTPVFEIVVPRGARKGSHRDDRGEEVWE